jgi:hypothetical protein
MRRPRVIYIAESHTCIPCPICHATAIYVSHNATQPFSLSLVTLHGVLMAAQQRHEALWPVTTMIRALYIGSVCYT